VDSKPPKSGFLDPKANFKSLIRVVAVIVILVGCLWAFVRYHAGQRAANNAVAVVLRQPIELKSSTENIPAASYEGFELRLPYDGTLIIEGTVMNGNGLDIYLVTSEQMDRIQSKRPFTKIRGFDATKTKNYARSARMAKDVYYLVAEDTSLGILSKTATDVKIHARLEP
jgi:hypothetical protein